MLQQTSEPAIEEEPLENMSVNKDPRAGRKPGAAPVFGVGRSHSLVGYVCRHDNGCCVHVHRQRARRVGCLSHACLAAHVYSAHDSYIPMMGLSSFCLPRSCSLL